MDLEIKDVADLLRVSESTIRGLLNDGKIPAYRINHQFRFCRIEIENWMMHSKLQYPESAPSALNEVQIYPPLEEQEPQKATSRGGMQHFCLYRAINQGDVLPVISGSTKEDIIRATTKAIAQKLNADADVLAELLIDREKLMATALNNGIAVPHTREILCKGPFDRVFVVYPEEPIDYGALDGKPVYALFFLFASNDKGHLQLLAKLAHFGSSPKALDILKTKPSRKDLLDFLRGWEGSALH